MIAMKRSALAAALAAVTLFTASAQAALFEDDEARRAILELRNRIGQLERTNTEQGSSLRDAATNELTIVFVRDRKESTVKATIDPPRRTLRGVA